MSTLKNNRLEAIGRGMFAPPPTISITDPILFNTCLAATADENDVRYYMGCLSIDPIKKTLTGCNGFFFISGEALDFSNLKNKEKLLILPSKKLPKEVSQATINLKTKSITGLAKKGRFNIPFSTAVAKYPKHDHLIANEENKVESENICLNPTFLRKLQKASFCMFTKMTAHKPESSSLFYDIELIGSQIRSEYTAIIMPGRA